MYIKSNSLTYYLTYVYINRLDKFVHEGKVVHVVYLDFSKTFDTELS